MTIDIKNESKNPLPKYETVGSAGFDIRIDLDLLTNQKNPKGLLKKALLDRNDNKSILLMPKEKIVLPTGLSFPKGFNQNNVLKLVIRSGVALKTWLRLGNGLGIVDSDYTGQIKLLIVNDSINMQEIKDGERLAQGIFEPIVRVSEWNTKNGIESTIKDKKRNGGFGSTN